MSDDARAALSMLLAIGLLVLIGAVATAIEGWRKRRGQR